jgi:hypothetical protein
MLTCWPTPSALVNDRYLPRMCKWIWEISWAPKNRKLTMSLTSSGGSFGSQKWFQGYWHWGRQQCSGRRDPAARKFCDSCQKFSLFIFRDIYDNLMVTLPAGLKKFQVKSPHSFTLKCLWKFSSGTYSQIVKGIAWEKWKYSTVETSLKGGVNIVFFFWIFLRTCVKVAAKNVVICRGTPQPLTNRVRYSFSFFPYLQKMEKFRGKILNRSNKITYENTLYQKFIKN